MAIVSVAVHIPGGFMRARLSILIAVVFVAASAAAQKPLTDFAGLKDPALFTRMPNFFLLSAASVVDKQFDSYTFMVKGEKAVERKAVEGHLTAYKYVFDKNAGAIPSRLQILRNYQSAAAAIGGEVVYEDQSRTTIVVAKGGNETWVDVSPIPNGYEYSLTIVERQAMRQNVLANAEAFKAGLAQAGHVEVPGIFFDTGKSEVKPESDAALKEVVKLLQADPALGVWVVGHTDNTGAEDMNVSLSQARATAVLKALSQMGIAPTRLAAHGAGPYAPVAENKTEAGRAKNRRVELVARQ
jgi:OOP family OmpA-OmpF porin